MGLHPPGPQPLRQGLCWLEGQRLVEQREPGPAPRSAPPGGPPSDQCEGRVRLHGGRWRCCLWGMLWVECSQVVHSTGARSVDEALRASGQEAETKLSFRDPQRQRFRWTQGIEAPGKELLSLPWSRGAAALPSAAWWGLGPSASVISLLSELRPPLPNTADRWLK